MAGQTHWRLALMFDSIGGDLAHLEEKLKQASSAIQAAARSCPVRIGIADMQPGLFGDSAEGHPRQSVDGAVEVTLPNAKSGDIPEICRALRPLLQDFVKLETCQVMAGPMFPMVETRRGGSFLSLAFRRFPGTTSDEFQSWWFHQHSKIAIPVLGSGLLSYDQVHVDQAVSDIASLAFGVPTSLYDAYDNLTWADLNGFIESISDPEAMERVNADEVGRIDDSTRRASMMRDIT